MSMPEHLEKRQELFNRLKALDFYQYVKPNEIEQAQLRLIGGCNGARSG
jgi:hypothetical protein